MSRGSPSEMEGLALYLTCRYCFAPPGTWCRTRGGRWAQWIHGLRDWEIRQAWHIGYQVGRDVGRKNAAHDSKQ